ncbi:MAG: DUF6221 family protein [Pseudonocardia sp.]|nr:DUF6221 family protein [Pseudonocardia sp.]
MLARLEELEEWARYAGPARPGRPGPWAVERSGPAAVVVDAENRDLCGHGDEEEAAGFGMALAVADHVAEWAPDAALELIEQERRTIALHLHRHRCPRSWRHLGGTIVPEEPRVGPASAVEPWQTLRLLPAHSCASLRDGRP